MSKCAASRSLSTDMHRITSTWRYFLNPMHKATAHKLAEMWLCTRSCDTPA